MSKKKLFLLFTTFLILAGAATGTGYYFYLQITQETKQPNRQIIQVSTLQKKVARLAIAVNNLKKQQKKNLGFGKKTLKKIVGATVKITTNIHTSPYESAGKSFASGIIVNLKHKLIVTNVHVVGMASMATYTVEFYNGITSTAKLRYVDPLVDIAFLEVDSIPDTANQVILSTTQPKPNEDIFMVGNNGAEGISYCTGYITALHNIIRVDGYPGIQLPTPCFSYSLNNKGGSSGSGIFNNKSHFLGLHFAGSSVSGKGLPVTYIQYFLPFVKQRKMPPRKQIGVVVEEMLLHEIKPYANLTDAQIATYNKKCPQALGKSIIVDYLLKGSSAYNLLKPGDLILAVFAPEKIILGNDLCALDLAMSRTKSNTITLEIYRAGQIQKIKIPLQPVQTIQRMVYFGGAVFFESDSYWSDVTASPPGKVTFFRIEKGKSFSGAINLPYKKFVGTITHINNTPIKNLDNLVKLIPNLVAQKNFTMRYTNAYQEHKISGVTYNKKDPKPRLLQFNRDTLTWEIQEIGEQGTAPNQQVA